MRHALFGLAALALAGFFNTGQTPAAERATFTLVIENHVFQPAELSVPAGQKVKLVVRNNDPTPEEFESYELNREKIISGGGEATIFIGPLDPGRYAFFGEFSPDTAQGVIVAE